MSINHKLQVDKIKANVMSNIKSLLRKHDISLIELASRASVGYGALYNIVNNNANFTLETIVKISTAFDIGVSQLIGETELEKPQYIKSIPIIKWIDILHFVASNTSNVQGLDVITVTSNTHELHKMFAIRSNEQTMHHFPADTIFVFNRIERNIKLFDSHFVISVTDEAIIQFGKLIVSGNDLFLQNYNPHIPPNLITENIKIIAYLHETHTCFNSLPTLNW